MSIINKHWPRWVFASISKHFDDHRQGLPMYIEGQHRDTRSLKDFIELRLDGPQFTEISKGYWRLYFEVNILAQSAMDEHNYHRIYTTVGIVAAAFSGIVMFKYGKGPDDDQKQFACAHLLMDTKKRQHLDIFHFGLIDKQLKLEQATVEGHYETFLEV
jgi:hypothetical protein